MIDKKYTDKDIISSLEVIATTCNCNECKIRSGKWGTCNCSETTANAALDLINRQKTEIDRLQKEVNLVSIQFQDIQEREEESQAEIDKLNKVYQANQQLINALNKSYFLAKAEAIKEFAERLKNCLENCRTVHDYVYVGYDSGDTLETIDNLVKEMTNITG